LPSATCQTCGERLADSSRRVCDTCLRERRSAAGTIGRRGSTGVSTMPDLASDRQMRREAAIRWEEVSRSEPRDRRAFDEQIRVGLRNVPISAGARRAASAARLVVVRWPAAFPLLTKVVSTAYISRFTGASPDS